MSVILTTTRNMSRDEWLEARKNGIGGSDISAICGLNKYKSIMEVYLDKLGIVEKDDSTNEAAYWGNVLEETVAKEFSIRTGKKVRNRNAILRHKEYPWMIANLDRVVVGEKAILECKTSSAYLGHLWEGEEVPEAYLLQVQHYLAVTGLEKAYIACLIGGQKFVYKVIHRDEELIETLIEIEKDFWTNNIQKKIPPALDGSDASKSILDIMYPRAIKSEVLTLSNDIENLINKRNVLIENKKNLKEEIQEIDNKIKETMGENEVAITDNFKLKWSNYNVKRFDSKSFRIENPSIYDNYLKETISRRFSISELKGDK